MAKTKKYVTVIEAFEFDLIMEALDALQSNIHETLRNETDREAIDNDFENRSKALDVEELTNRLNEVRKFG